MLSGRDGKQVAKTHMKYARSLLNKGVDFRSLDESDYSTVRELVKNHIVGADDIALNDTTGGVVALDTEGSTIGTLLVQAGAFDNGTVVFIRYLVVDPTWRGHGLGTVCLGVIPQVHKVRDISMTVGCCAPHETLFYRNAGFTVLDEGEPVPIPYGAGGIVHNPDQHHTHWFYRDW